jgi:hypothetical protein
MLGAEGVRLLDEGVVQFILFGVMVLVIFVMLWFTIAK